MRRKVSIIFFIKLLFIFSGVLTADPVIFSNIEVVAIRDNTVIIRWDTDIAATGQVEYGQSTGYGSLTAEDGLSYWHSIEVTGLIEGTEYHFRIRAVDYEGNETISGDSVFTTRTQTELDSIVRAARPSGDLPKVYYVKTDGNNSLDGMTIATAWKYPSYAVRQLHAGDTLWVMEGTYYDSTTSKMYSDNMGIETHWVIIKSHPDNTEMPVWDGNGILTSGFELYYCSTQYSDGFVELDGIYITRYARHTIIICNISNLIIKNCSFTNTSVAPDWRSIMNLGDGVRDIIIDNCTFLNSSNFCINAMGDRYSTSKKSYHLLVSNCHLEHTYNHGAIQLSDYASHMTVAGNTFVDCYCGFDTYFHELATNPNRQSNLVVRDNIFTDITYYPMYVMGTINSLFINNTVNRSGYSAFCVTGYCNNVMFKDNIVSTSLRIHDDYNAGHPNIFTTYENNIYSGIISENIYYVRSGGVLVIRDDIHQPGFKVNMRNIDTIGETIIEYTDGHVFNYNIIVGTTYTLTDPYWHPDKSDFTFKSEEDIDLIIEIIPYNMTVLPDSDSLEVNIITWDTTGTFYKKWQEICESPTVATSHTVGDIHPNSTVEVKVNSIPYDTFIADTAGWIVFDYTGGFSQDTVIFEAEVISSVVEEIIKNPLIYFLSQNFPNPFHSSTEIRYQLPADNSTEHIRLDIFDASGRLIRNLVNEGYKAGYYQVTWDGKDANNQSVSGGVYFYSLTAGNYKAEEKMIIIK